jgi:hypothetical protein
MTVALCFNCGSTKFGAFIPCSECRSSATGNPNLDIAFSDHELTEETIEAFGSVIKAIHRACDDAELCFWSFIRYVSEHHPDILKVHQTAEVQAKLDEILTRAAPPEVVVVHSEAARRRKEEKAAGEKTD